MEVYERNYIVISASATDNSISMADIQKSILREMFK